MYHSNNTDEYLLKQFSKLCAIPIESERIKSVNSFFHLQLDETRISDYEIQVLSTDPIVRTQIKDNLTGEIYSANYDNNSHIPQYSAVHAKYIHVIISYPQNIEREKIFYRSSDSLPLHDEVCIKFNNYKMILWKNYPKGCMFPCEEGIYLSLTDLSTPIAVKKYYSKIDETNEFFHRSMGLYSFDVMAQEFIYNKEFIFNEIMKTLEE